MSVINRGHGPATVADPIVPLDGTQNITGALVVSGNITGANLIATTNVSAATIGTTGNIDSAATVEAKFFQQDGTQNAILGVTGAEVLGRAADVISWGNNAFWQSHVFYANGGIVSTINTSGIALATGLDVFINTTPLNAYGSIYYDYSGGGAGQTVNNTFEILDVWNGNGAANQCTADQANNRIAVTAAGEYAVDFSISFAGNTASDIWTFALYAGTIASTAINNEMVLQRKVAANDVGNAGFNGTVTLTAGQVVEVWVKQSVAADHTLTVYACNLRVKAVGE